MMEIRNNKKGLCKTYKSFKWFHIICLTLLAVVLIQPSAVAQRNAYRQLDFRYNRTGIYVTTFALPGEAQNEIQLTIPFRISYGMLSFKTVNEPGSSAFYATPVLRVEIYRSPRKNLRFDEQISIVDLESIARATWSDTVLAADYEASENKSNFSAGFMQVQLRPGYYTYVLILNRNGTDRKTSATRNIHIPSYSKGESGEIIFGDEFTGTRLNLLNMGGNVLFGENYYGLIHLPNFSLENNYRLKVTRVNISGDDTTQVETIFEEDISDEQLIKGATPDIRSDNDQLYLQLNKSSNGLTYAVVQIPNSNWPDAVYKMKVYEAESGETVAQKTYRSLWLDKPVSLYNLDLAIEMLRFIANEKTVERIANGSAEQEREQFNTFWKKRDPTPNTAFNELKTEYYQRIDYAYRHFSSSGTPGFETDQGRIYILYGPPEDIERFYPSEGATREVWTYPNRRFVFKATSGYGDFVLIEK